MKKFLYTLFISFLILTVVRVWIPALSFGNDIKYVIFFYISFAIVPLVLDRVVSFLTLPKNFFSLLLVQTILYIIVLYTFVFFIPGIKATSISVKELVLGFLSLESIKLTVVGSLVIFSLLCSSIYQIISFLGK